MLYIHKVGPRKMHLDWLHWWCTGNRHSWNMSKMVFWNWLSMAVSQAFSFVSICLPEWGKSMSILSLYLFIIDIIQWDIILLSGIGIIFSCSRPFGGKKVKPEHLEWLQTNYRSRPPLMRKTSHALQIAGTYPLFAFLNLPNSQRS